MIKRIFSIVGAFGVSAVLLAIFLRWVAPVAAAGIIVVNPGESIQAAIDGASAGDTILIMAGTYTESLTLNKAVSLTGVSSATTILRAEPNDRVLTATGAAITRQVVISGLMVTGGFIPNSGDGGGVLLLDFAHPSFINVLFYDNYAKNGGGLWDEEQASTLYFTGTSFINNYGNDVGGAMYIGDGVVVGGRFIRNECFGGHFKCAGGAIDGDSLIISGATFISNTARTGGAIFSWNATVTNSFFGQNYCALWDSCNGGAIRVAQLLTISHSTFLSNEASYTGGAIFSGGMAKVINSSIVGNVCDHAFCWGGGMYVSSLGLITGTTFSNNTSGGFGGGIFAWRNLVVSDSVVTGNLAGEAGGGVYIGGLIDGAKKIINSSFEENQCISADCDGGGVWVSGTIAITGANFVSNTAVGIGGGLYAEGDIRIRESVVEGNSASQGAGAYLEGVGWVVDSRFEGNDGSGIYANNGTLRVTNSVIRDNIGKNFALGAGLSADYLYLTGTNIVNNTHVGSNGVGAGAVAFAEAIVVDSYFADNSCLVNPGCDGGGLRVYGPLTLMQSAFVNNAAARDGGAVYVQQTTGQQLEGGSTAVLVNNLFAENTAGSDGAALYFESGAAEIVHNTIAGASLNSGQAIYVDGGTAAITNTIITSHAVGIENDGGVVSEDYNVYFGNSVNTIGTISSGGSSIVGDPDFVDPTADDYHIGFASAGLDNALDVGILEDLDGNPRPIGAGPDRGAYEAGIPTPIMGLLAVNDSPTVLGDGTMLTATVTAGDGIAYSWDFGDGAQGSGALASHIYPAVGVYTAVITASNSLNMMTATTIVTVVDEAIEGLTVSSNSPVQFGEAIILTATVSAGSNVTYSWDFGDGSSGVGQVVSHTYGMEGSYTVTVTATNQVGEVVVSAVVVVLEEENTWQVYMPVIVKP